MSGKAAVTEALQPSTVVTAAPVEQKCFPFVLKKIMDIPPPNILEEGDDGKIKMMKIVFPVSAMFIHTTI